MPMKLHDYPPDWPAISRRVRFERAGGRCEWPGCGARHDSVIVRKRDGEPYRGRDGMPLELDGVAGEIAALEGDRVVKVVLTTAHACDCRPKCGDESHLLGLCQRCHLRLDAPDHRRNAAATRRRKAAERGQGFLIEDIDEEAAR